MIEGLSYDDVLLVPKHGVLDSRKHADISSELVPGIRLDIPILSANMPSVTEAQMANQMADAGGMGVLHRFGPDVDHQVSMFLDSKVETACAIGIKQGIYRTDRLAQHGATIFCLDVAHGDSVKVIEFVKKWKKEFPSLHLIVGNVATEEGTERILDTGINAIKVGIGPGAACITREVTGFGIPQLTAVSWCSELKDRYDYRIIADGGIKSSGDIVKALAVGADTVMVGRLLAGCDEAPHPGEYFGNASQRMNGHNAPEGIEGIIEKIGPVVDVIKKLAWGIRSGVSYAGARNLAELRETAEFIKVGPLSQIETLTRM